MPGRNRRAITTSRSHSPPERSDDLSPGSLLVALRALGRGDLTERLSDRYTGVAGEIATAINVVIDRHRALANELSRTARLVGKEGQLGQRAQLSGATGSWRECIDSVNQLIVDMVHPTIEVGRVIGSVAAGDLSQKMALSIDGRRLRGQFLSTARLVNDMVKQLGLFASEVTRVAREVGVEGKLGGQARVKAVAGTWKDLTDSVNMMAGNLTGQVRNIAEVTTAVARGDLSKKITVDVRGEILQLKGTINTMVDQLNAFASEVTRVAREVGTEGKLGGQAHVPGVGGTWKDLTDNVNSMASNLTGQVRNIAEVATAVARGDLTKRITVDVQGEILQLKDTINTMAGQLNAFAGEVTRVAREVGTEGKLGGQAVVEGVGGTWKDLTDSVNWMASNLTGQVRNIADVTTAVARGDLTRKITVNVKGEIRQLKDTINTMVDQLNAFAGEVTRVAREVGTEGVLGGQAQVSGVAGTWKDLTDSVNSMASNLTGQVRNIADVTTAVAKGDLTKKIAVPVKGEILELKKTINTMVDQLNAFAGEVTRVAREVGTEGRLGGQAQVPGVAGTWKDLTDSVNSMASNLTGQVRNIADVTTAVARGDLSKKIAVQVRGEILELKNTINTMVDQLRAFAAEVTRVAREVGTEGVLGGQAQVPGVAGTWKDLTDSVNSMASNLTGQVRNIADVTTAVAKGDLTRKITVDVKGEIRQLKDTINTMVDQLNAFAGEVTRVAREVGTEGRLGGQAFVKGVGGTWKDLTDNVNSMASNLTGQVRNIAEVTTAVAGGDLSKKITVDVKGEILELKNTINTMVDQLNAFAGEVTRVAREVGTEGKLGGQARVPGVAGTWKDLTDNVNSMASNLTAQVRGIAVVVTAVAGGDLKRKLALEARGEIAQLAETINFMTETLATLAEQVTSVAREVGVEGRLGGQARVPGAAGTWRDLVDNVNELAGNLTTQVRAISDVATAVTKGDLTRSITVHASGEVAALKDNINEMIGNLRETTLKTTEQDWFKTNLARFTRQLQGQRDLVSVAQQILSELAPLVAAPYGVFYMAERDSSSDGEGEVTLRSLASYGVERGSRADSRFQLGQGVVGQCAFEKRRILLTEVPPDYIRISSGLGAAPPLNIVVLPVLFEGRVNAVIELAAFTRWSDIHLVFLDQLTESIGIVVNTIAAGMQTEALLQQSQSLTQELQLQQLELSSSNERLENQAATLRESEERLRQQQEELQRTNDQLQEKAELLEIKNREVEFGRSELEEKAEQLALTSRYKSEFLANMSHELRTPLNSLLILSNLLSQNLDCNLSAKQVEMAAAIHGSGYDLLSLIDDILDLSKVESGTISVEPSEVSFSALRDYVEQNFRHVAEQKQLEFAVELGIGLGSSITTDAKRLQQVLKNLLANAFKFTDRGKVTLSMRRAQGGWRRENPVLARTDDVVAFTVTDSGIGIPSDKHKIIFEAFQQADGTTSRKYGGTGLGLSISREIANLLGGEIHVESGAGGGSSFTLYLPRIYAGSPAFDPSDRKVEVLDLSRAPVRIAAAPADRVGEPDEDEPGEALASIVCLDDRERIEEGDRVLLVAEHEPDLTGGLLEGGRSAGFKVLTATSGAQALSLVRRFGPAAMALDLALPERDGWTVLDQLKHDIEASHIPILALWHRYGEVDAPRGRALRMGAHGFLTVPADPGALPAAVNRLAALVAAERRTLLLVEEDPAERSALLELIGSGDIDVVVAGTGAEALDVLGRQPVHSMVVDLRLPDMSGAEVVRRTRDGLGTADVPVILYSGGELPAPEASRLGHLAEGVVTGGAGSPERLLEMVSRFMHRRHASMPEAQRALLEEYYRTCPALEGKTILVVDDDVRNIFAVSSALERYRARVLFAENGADGLSILEQEVVDAVLMDIMMPELNGYEVMWHIRQRPRLRDLPIIAVTAKAMPADRDKCILAGACDYIAKPVDLAQLLSVLRVRLAS